MNPEGANQLFSQVVDAPEPRPPDLRHRQGDDERMAASAHLPGFNDDGGSDFGGDRTGQGWCAEPERSRSGPADAGRSDPVRHQGAGAADLDRAERSARSAVDEGAACLSGRQAEADGHERNRDGPAVPAAAGLAPAHQRSSGDPAEVSDRRSRRGQGRCRRVRPGDRHPRQRQRHLEPAAVPAVQQGRCRQRFLGPQGCRWASRWWPKSTG